MDSTGAYQSGFDNAMALHGRAMESTERARMEAVDRAVAAEQNVVALQHARRMDAHRIAEALDKALGLAPSKRGWEELLPLVEALRERANRMEAAIKWYLRAQPTSTLSLADKALLASMDALSEPVDAGTGRDAAGSYAGGTKPETIDGSLSASGGWGEHANGTPAHAVPPAGGYTASGEASLDG